MCLVASLPVELISKPRTEALARLTVSMIISAWLAVQQQQPVKNEVRHNHCLRHSIRISHTLSLDVSLSIY